MFEFCWFISELIVWIFYGFAIMLMIGTIYKFMNPEDEDTLMAKVGRIVSLDFDDEDEIYESE